MTLNHKIDHSHVGKLILPRSGFRSRSAACVVTRPILAWCCCLHFWCWPSSRHFDLAIRDRWQTPWLGVPWLHLPKPTSLFFLWNPVAYWSIFMPELLHMPNGYPVPEPDQTCFLFCLSKLSHVWAMTFHNGLDSQESTHLYDEPCHLRICLSWPLCMAPIT